MVLVNLVGALSCDGQGIRVYSELQIVGGTLLITGARKMFGVTATMCMLTCVNLCVTGSATLIMLFPEVEQVVRLIRFLKVVTDVAPMTMLCLLLTLVLPVRTCVVVVPVMPNELTRPIWTACLNRVSGTGFLPLSMCFVFRTLV